MIIYLLHKKIDAQRQQQQQQQRRMSDQADTRISGSDSDSVPQLSLSLKAKAKAEEVRNFELYVEAENGTQNAPQQKFFQFYVP